MERAVIWVADGDEWERWAERCVDYCTRREYTVVAVVNSRTGGTWADVDQYLRDGHADLAVVADRDQLPRDRPRRVESVAEERHRMDLTVPNQRAWAPTRPEMMRRTAGC